MAQILIYLCIALLSAIALFLVDSDSPAFGVIAGILVGFLIPLSDADITNRRHLRFAWYSLRYARQTVRVSASYLYRIRLDGEYLLIKGRRYPQYQPVGGVWKTGPTASGFLKEIGAKTDDLIPQDDWSEHDIRIRIAGIHLHKFVRWYESGKGREVGPWREFYEELVRPGYLSVDDFPYVMHDQTKRIYRPMRYSPYAQSRELLIADVFELLPTNGQAQSLRRLRDTTPPDITWVTEEQISRRGAVPGENTELIIAEPAEWIL